MRLATVWCNTNTNLTLAAPITDVTASREDGASLPLQSLQPGVMQNGRESVEGHVYLHAPHRVSIFIDLSTDTFCFLDSWNSELARADTLVTGPSAGPCQWVCLMFTFHLSILHRSGDPQSQFNNPVHLRENPRCKRSPITNLTYHDLKHFKSILETYLNMIRRLKNAF